MTATDDRQARRAAALRDNLQRRKRQVRAAEAEPPPAADPQRQEM